MPLYTQLYLALKEMILSGELKEGEKLPTIRKASELLKVNSVTVVNSYKELASEGLIQKKTGSGSFVNFKREVKNNRTLDFTGKDSHIEIFPIDEIRGTINEVLTKDGSLAFQNEAPEGYAPLRVAIKEYLHYFQIHCIPEDVQVISGAQQGLDILSKALLDFGDTVITESPTYTGAMATFKSRSCRIIQIPLEHDGIDIQALKTRLKVTKPSFIYVMPYCQNPTGNSYSVEKLKELLDLAEKYNTYILEDDSGSELGYIHSGRPSLKSLDTKDRVIYLKSFSSLFMPGLRLGFLLLPGDLRNKIKKVKQSTDKSTTGLIQRSFSLYLSKKNWPEYYRKVNLILRDKMEKTSLAAEAFLKGLVTWNTPEEGWSFWFKLKKGSGDTLYRICHEKELFILPGSRLTEEYTDCFRLSVKSIASDVIEDGIKTLSECIKEMYREEKEDYIDFI